MGSYADYLALVKNNNLIAINDCGQSVGYDNHGSSLSYSVNSLTHALLV
jgi:hypothetical protein